MKHRAALLVLALGCATAALAAGSTAPPGFVDDLAQAQKEAMESGKLIFVFFQLPG